MRLGAIAAPMYWLCTQGPTAQVLSECRGAATSKGCRQVTIPSFFSVWVVFCILQLPWNHEWRGQSTCCF